MRMSLAMGLVFGLLLGADAVQGEEALQGTWVLTSGEANGKALTEKELQGAKLVIKGEHYTVTLDGKGTTTGVQKLDAAPKIKTIDITDDSGANKGKTCLGIYELKENEFRVSFAPPGKARPSKFSTTPDSGHWTHTWKRMSK